MRLLHISSLTFQTFPEDALPPYLIASHRWGEDEASFQAFGSHRSRASRGYTKIQSFCNFAQDYRRDIAWIWIDSCCIDRTNLFELNEAVNSIFIWYLRADECIAYLGDTPQESFLRSSWFSRSWTLPELLAPKCVVFVARGWRVVGHKCSLAHASVSRQGHEMDEYPGPNLNEALSMRTGVRRTVLDDFRSSRYLSLEERLSWTHGREAALQEDRTYSLMGIFDVFMNIRYGEGDEQARARLADMMERQGYDNSRTLLVGHYTMPERYYGSSRLERAGSGFPEQTQGASNETGYPLTTNEQIPGQYLHSDTAGGPYGSEHPPTNTLRNGYGIGSARSNEYLCLYEPCCSNLVGFARKADLERHMRVKHPRSALELVDCEHPGCHRTGNSGFTRIDKMIEHMREVHRAPIPRRSSRS